MYCLGSTTNQIKDTVVNSFVICTCLANPQCCQSTCDYYAIVAIARGDLSCSGMNKHVKPVLLSVVITSKREVVVLRE